MSDTEIIDTDLIEIDPDNVEIIELTETADEPEHHKKARFIIENHNAGTVIRLKARLDATIQKVIGGMYSELGRGHIDGDKLTRVSDGSNVFDSASLTVAQYLDGAHLGQRVRWAFVGATGGARK